MVLIYQYQQLGQVQVLGWIEVVTGDLCIGGRYTNRNFNGEVASMVITTLRTDDNLPTNAEITAMVKDPMQWIVDYKEGNNFRHCTTEL